MSKDLIVPYRLEDRKERYKRIVYKQIQDYIKNGSIGGLMLDNTPIESLPSNLKTVGGVLDLNDSKILELPEGLTVHGFLDLSGTPIKILPNNLTVGSTLWLYYTQIEEIPMNLNIGTNLRLYQSNLSVINEDRIVQMIKERGGSIGGQDTYK